MNLYVKTDGNDSNDGSSWDLAVQHIYKAIELANDGDTIIIREGTYHEDEGRIITNKSLTIKSETDNFEDVKIIVDGVVSAQNWHVSLWRLKFNSSYTFKIQSVTFKWGTATYSAEKGFIMPDDDYSPNIEVVKCFFDGSNIPSGDNHIGVGGEGTSNVRIYKSTFRHFTGCHSIYQYCGGVSFYKRSTTLLDVKDCIFEDCIYGINNQGSISSFTEDHNCFYNNTHNLYSGSLDSTDLTSDPKFTGTNVAELQDTSPCIDVGVTITGYVEDYEGNAPDIGCYESSSTTEVLSDISSDIRVKKEVLSDIIQDIRFFKGTYKDIISDIRFSKPIFYDINTLIKVAKETFKDINSDIRTIKPYYNDILTNIKFKKNFVYVEWNAPSGFDGLGFTYYYTTDGSEPDDSSNYTTNTHIYWTLSEGLNILKIKVKDSLGNWGMTSSFRLVYSDNDIEGGVAN